MQKLFGGSSWEFVVWYLIDQCIYNSAKSFSRGQLLRKDYEEIYCILKLLGHKKRPTHPEATIDKTLQNMRDKKWILFLGQGDYKLTEEGFREYLAKKDHITSIKGLSAEDRKLLRGMTLL